MWRWWLVLIGLLCLLLELPQEAEAFSFSFVSKGLKKHANTQQQQQQQQQQRLPNRRGVFYSSSSLSLLQKITNDDDDNNHEEEEEEEEDNPIWLNVRLDVEKKAAEVKGKDEEEEAKRQNAAAKEEETSIKAKAEAAKTKAQQALLDARRKKLEQNKATLNFVDEEDQGAMTISSDLIVPQQSTSFNKAEIEQNLSMMNAYMGGKASVKESKTDANKEVQVEEEISDNNNTSNIEVEADADIGQDPQAEDDTKILDDDKAEEEKIRSEAMAVLELDISKETFLQQDNSLVESKEQIIETLEASDDDGSTEAFNIGRTIVTSSIVETPPTQTVEPNKEEEEEEEEEEITPTIEEPTMIEQDEVIPELDKSTKDKDNNNDDVVKLMEVEISAEDVETPEIILDNPITIVDENVAEDQEQKIETEDTIDQKATISLPVTHSLLSKEEAELPSQRYMARWKKLQQKTKGIDKVEEEPAEQEEKETTSELSDPEAPIVDKDIKDEDEDIETPAVESVVIEPDTEENDIEIVGGAKEEEVILSDVKLTSNEDMTPVETAELVSEETIPAVTVSTNEEDSVNEQEDIMAMESPELEFDNTVLEVVESTDEKSELVEEVEVAESKMPAMKTSKLVSKDPMLEAFTSADVDDEPVEVELAAATEPTIEVLESMSGETVPEVVGSAEEMDVPGEVEMTREESMAMDTSSLVSEEPVAEFVESADEEDVSENITTKAVDSTGEAGVPADVEAVKEAETIVETSELVSEEPVPEVASADKEDILEEMSLDDLIATAMAPLELTFEETISETADDIEKEERSEESGMTANQEQATNEVSDMQSEGTVNELDKSVGTVVVEHLKVDAAFNKEEMAMEAPEFDSLESETELADNTEEQEVPVQMDSSQSEEAMALGALKSLAEETSADATAETLLVPEEEATYDEKGTTMAVRQLPSADFADKISASAKEETILEEANGLSEMSMESKLLSSGETVSEPTGSYSVNGAADSSPAPALDNEAGVKEPKPIAFFATPKSAIPSGDWATNGVEEKQMAFFATAVTNDSEDIAQVAAKIAEEEGLSDAVEEKNYSALTKLDNIVEPVENDQDAPLLVKSVEEPKPVVVNMQRLFIRVSPKEAKRAWLDFVWKNGDGLPTLVLTLKQNSEGLYTKRLLFPTFMEEDLTDESENMIEYKVSRLGFLGKDLVANSHIGVVSFEETDKGTLMKWDITFDVFERQAFWKRVTEIVVGSVCDGLVAYLTESQVITNERDFPGKEPDEVMDAWVDYVWKQGGDLPLAPKPVNLGGNERAILPIFLRERLDSIDYDKKEIVYHVENPSLLTYPVHRHRGLVQFEYDAEKESTNMKWRVEVLPYNNFDVPVNVFTSFVVSTLSGNLRKYLLDPDWEQKENEEESQSVAAKAFAWMEGARAALEDRQLKAWRSMVDKGDSSALSSSTMEYIDELNALEDEAGLELDEAQVAEKAAAVELRLVEEEIRLAEEEIRSAEEEIVRVDNVYLDDTIAATYFFGDKPSDEIEDVVRPTHPITAPSLGRPTGLVQRPVFEDLGEDEGIIDFNGNDAEVDKEAPRPTRSIPLSKSDDQDDDKETKPKNFIPDRQQ